MADRPRRQLVVQMGLLWAFVLVCALPGCEPSHPANAPTRPAAADAEPLSAEVFVVKSSVYPDKVRSQGNLVADEVTVVGAKVAGRVAEVHTDVGDRISANDPLATLDRAEFELAVVLAQTQLVQARAALGLNADDPLERLNPQNAPPVREAQAVWDEAKLRTGRLQALLPKNAATREELDVAIAAERVAEARHASAVNGVLEKIAQIRVRGAELALAQQRLDDAVIPAPFDGQVQERHIAPGTFVQVGEPIVTLVRTSTLRFRGTMPERHAHRLALGQEVVLNVESMREPLTAQITRISPVVEERNRSLMFEVELPNSDHRLRSGLFAEAEVIVDPQARAIVIPPSSLVEFAGAEKVWKVIDGKATEQVVQTARRSKTAVEIVRGLEEGDVILLDAVVGRSAPVTPVSTGASGAPSPAALDSTSADIPPGLSPANVPTPKTLPVSASSE